MEHHLLQVQLLNHVGDAGACNHHQELKQVQAHPRDRDADDLAGRTLVLRSVLADALANLPVDVVVLAAQHDDQQQCLCHQQHEFCG